MSDTALPIRPEGHLALTRIAGGDAEAWALVSGVAAYLARLEKADGITGAHVEAAARIAAANELGDAIDGDDDGDGDDGDGDEAQADVPVQAAPEVRRAPASIAPLPAPSLPAPSLPVPASARPAAPGLPPPAARVPLGRNSVRPPRAAARRSPLLLPLLGGCLVTFAAYLGMAGDTRLASPGPADTPPLAAHAVPAIPAPPANSASVSPTAAAPPPPAAAVPAPAPAAPATAVAAAADPSAAPPRRRPAPPRAARTGPAIERTELPPPRSSADTYDALQSLIRRYSAGDPEPEAKQDPRSDMRADAKPEPRPEPRAEALHRRAAPAGEQPTRYIGSFVMGADGVRVFVPRP